MRHAHWRVFCGLLPVLLAGPLLAQEAEDSTFGDRIAPLLTRHCLECHNAEANKGGLNLSARETALAGGKRGNVLVPGKSGDSLLWRHIEADRMPPGERTKLSAAEKQQLREWIDRGAPWSGPTLAPAANAAGNVWVRRLTVDEYIETVRILLGVDVAEDARHLLPRDLRADGFSNTAYNLNIDFSHVEAYARLSERITTQVDLTAFAAQFTASRETSAGNQAALVAGMGRRLFRRPLELHEEKSLLKLAGVVVAEGGDFQDLCTFLLEAMLQSPGFLYRMEQEHEGGLNGFQRASRLSYLIWGGPPDAELLRAAAAGELAKAASAAAQVDRMLQDPRAAEHSRRFMHEWMNLDRLAALRPSPKHFPNWDERLATDMREETLAYFHEVAWRRNRPLAELFNAQFTIATPRLAAHYGLSPDLASTVEGGAAPAAVARVSQGLLALYSFQGGTGDTIRDLAETGEPLDLKIADTASIEWETEKLALRSPALLTTEKPPVRIVNAMKQSGELSLEAWLEPRDAEQAGPARIFTLSGDTSRRNLTLGQEGDRFDVRLRTTKTSENGLPSLASTGGAVAVQPTHVLFTRDPQGKTRLYVNGRESAAGNAAGDMKNWDSGFRLAVANEVTGDRPWLGGLYLAAIYDRALSAEEVRRNFEAGPSLSTAPLLYDLSSQPARGGLLTQAGVLTVGGDEGSMVTRGLFVLKELLYSGVEDPPPCVDTTPVPAKPGLSQRAISEQRIANQACNACHKKFETIAFGLERFDGLGGYREKDRHGNALREDGEILFPDHEEPVAFQTSAELMNLLAASPRVQMGITRKVTQFALGRPLNAADEPALEEIHRTAHAQGGTYAALLRAVVLSKLVNPTHSE